MQKWVTITLILLTIGIGTCGYMLNGETLYQGLLHGFKLLSPGGDGVPSNVVIEIARWCGIVFGLNVIFVIVFAAVSASAETARVWFRARKPNATAVHGDGVFADELAESFGEDGIRSERDTAFNAPVQVLLFSDDLKALEFYNLHKEKLAHAREVYICLDSVAPDVVRGENVFFFNLAEACAQLYWEAYPASEHERVAIVGSGSYSEAILTQALLTNVVSVEGGIAYRVYGDFARYKALHPRLDDMLSLDADTVEFCTRPWFEDLDELSACDRVILCGTHAENIEIASTMKTYGVQTPLHLRVDSGDQLGLIGAKDVTVFGTSEQLCNEAIVIQQHQHDAGKICAITYQLGTAMCNGCARQKAFPAASVDEQSSEQHVEEVKVARLRAVDLETCLACPKFQEQWRSMTEFTRASNYAVAAHDVQKFKLLRDRGIAAESAETDPRVLYPRLSQEQRDELQEIEHIRWCRFHFLNNWRYAPGGKNAQARTHHYLVPYSELSRPVKDLDSDAYLNLWYRNRG